MARQSRAGPWCSARPRNHKTVRRPEMQKSPKKDEINAKRAGRALMILHSAQMRFLAQEFPSELIPDPGGQSSPRLGTRPLLQCQPGVCCYSHTAHKGDSTCGGHTRMHQPLTAVFFHPQPGKSWSAGPQIYGTRKDGALPRAQHAAAGTGASRGKGLSILLHHPWLVAAGDGMMAPKEVQNPCCEPLGVQAGISMCLLGPVPASLSLSRYAPPLTSLRRGSRLPAQVEDAAGSLGNAASP